MVVKINCDFCGASSKVNKVFRKFSFDVLFAGVDYSYSNEQPTTIGDMCTNCSRKFRIAVKEAIGRIIDDMREVEVND